MCPYEWGMLVRTYRNDAIYIVPIFTNRTFVLLSIQLKKKEKKKKRKNENGHKNSKQNNKGKKMGKFQPFSCFETSNNFAKTFEDIGFRSSHVPFTCYSLSLPPSLSLSLSLSLFFFFFLVSFSLSIYPPFHTLVFLTIPLDMSYGVSHLCFSLVLLSFFLFFFLSLFFLFLLYFCFDPSSIFPALCLCLCLCLSLSLSLFHAYTCIHSHTYLFPLFIAFR